MSRCRCYDIQVVEGDIRKLGEIEGVIGRMNTVLSRTDEATDSLKGSIQAAVDVALGGVSTDMYSRAGREATASASSAVAARRVQLEEALRLYRAEDERYHEQLRLEALQRAERQERLTAR